MQKIKDFCNVKQQATLGAIHALMDRFYESSDNAVTYALTGLIQHLTSLEYTDPRYIQEKVEIIIKELYRA